MSQRVLHPFALTTEADFTAEGVWLIEVDFSFDRTAVGPVRALLNEARLAVMAALTRQGLRGWSLGAKTVRVRLNSGTHQTDFLLPPKTLASNLRVLWHEQGGRLVDFRRRREVHRQQRRAASS